MDEGAVQFSGETLELEHYLLGKDSTRSFKNSHYPQWEFSCKITCYKLWPSLRCNIISSFLQWKIVGKNHLLVGRVQLCKHLGVRHHTLGCVSSFPLWVWGSYLTSLTPPSVFLPMICGRRCWFQSIIRRRQEIVFLKCWPKAQHMAER